MLTQPTLSEKIISNLANVEEYLSQPKTVKQAIGFIDRHMYRARKKLNEQERRMRKRIQEALGRLRETHFLSFSKETGKYKLTPKGWLKFVYYHSLRAKKEKPDSKKQKYIIVFDIPEQFKRFRDLFRKSLQNMGSFMIQKSVFVCPNKEVYIWAKKVVYNCELTGHVLFVEANRYSK